MRPTMALTAIVKPSRMVALATSSRVRVMFFQDQTPRVSSPILFTVPFQQ